MIAGVDGYKKGWITTVEDGSSITVRPFSSFIDIVRYAGVDLVVVDIPIGLLEKGILKTDEEARRLLKARACCVFNAPLRPILKCTGYRDALDILRNLGQKGMSAQSWNIVGRVREVDSVLQSRPDLQNDIREGHPEVSFAMMNQGQAVPFGKHKPAGEAARLELLEKHFGAEGERCLRGIPKYARNDVIDALAMLWTARRVSKWNHQILGGEIDVHGIRAEIVV